MSRPMIEAAPGRLSISTCCPSTSDRRGAKMRSSTSVEPPGAYGTMMRIGLAGYACPELVEWVCAGAGEAHIASDADASAAAANLTTVRQGAPCAAELMVPPGMFDF